jgi:hypothetical protein
MSVAKWAGFGCVFLVLSVFNAHTMYVAYHTAHSIVAFVSGNLSVVMAVVSVFYFWGAYKAYNLR